MNRRDFLKRAILVALGGAGLKAAATKSVPNYVMLKSGGIEKRPETTFFAEEKWNDTLTVEKLREAKRQMDAAQKINPPIFITARQAEMFNISIKPGAVNYLFGSEVVMV